MAVALVVFHVKVTVPPLGDDGADVVNDSMVGGGGTTVAGFSMRQPAKVAITATEAKKERAEFMEFREGRMGYRGLKRTPEFDWTPGVKELALMTSACVPVGFSSQVTLLMPEPYWLTLVLSINP